MTTTILRAAAVLAVTLAITPAMAGPLENLERERAIMLSGLLSPDIPAAERQEKSAVSLHRLVDLERQVLRDVSLAGKTTPVVRTAFQSYDLTFLAHASTEKGRTILDHWLEQLGLSTEAVMAARVGRR